MNDDSLNEEQLHEALLSMSEEEMRLAPPEVKAAYDALILRLQEDQERAEKERQQRLMALGQRIVGQYNDRKTQRQQLELRWLEDIRRYNGQYDDRSAAALANRKFGSRAFVPLTRRVIDIVEARMVDLLFPSNERGFMVIPTAVPELVRGEQLAMRLPPEMEVPLGPGGQPLRAGAVAVAIRELREEAKIKAENMQRKVDDQLQESNWPAVARRMIHDALVTGTGVCKGPHVVSRTKRAWVGGQFVERTELVATAEYVPFWDFFPDMSAHDIRESESDIQRHYLTRADTARLARQPGFEWAEADFQRILKAEPGQRMDQNIDQLRVASGLQGVKDPRYLFLEYRGPVTAQELVDAGVEVDVDDELTLYEGIVWVYEDGTVVKAAVEPLDTQERCFSAYCWRKDPGSIFGFGLSYEVSDLQEAANSSFRAGLDNMGLSVGVILGINDKDVYPQSGRWDIEPNMVLRGKRTGVDMTKAITAIQVPNNLQSILELFNLSKGLLDEIGGPQMAMQGQDAPAYLNTALGTAIAHTAANVWFRRGVAHWDDDITTPMVGRFVDWNMQFADDDNIKGDFTPQARGRSALLEAELQAQKMMYFAGLSKDVPMPYARRISQLREIAKALRIDTADTLPDEVETKRIGEKVDNQPPPVDPAVERIKLRQAEIADNAAQREHEFAVEQYRGSIRLAEIASREQITIEEARARYGLDQLKVTTEIMDRREQRAHDAQALNAELAVKLQKGTGI